MRTSDRRLAKRHDPEMELQFSCRSRGLTCIGAGRTTSLDSVEVAFEADRELPESGELELRIMWPFLLQSVCPLELVVFGSIVRSAARKTVVHIDRYEFRTRGEHSFEPAIAKGMTCDLVA